MEVILLLKSRSLSYKTDFLILVMAFIQQPINCRQSVLLKKYIKEKGLDWDNYNGGEANVDWHEVYDIISTPVIYLLDQDKKIVGKKLNAVVLEKLFDVLEPEKSKMAKEQKAAKDSETETENNNK